MKLGLLDNNIKVTCREVRITCVIVLLASVMAISGCGISDADTDSHSKSWSALGQNAPCGGAELPSAHHVLKWNQYDITNPITTNADEVTESDKSVQDAIDSNAAVPESEQHFGLDVEEFGRTIAMGSAFWEDWWLGRGRFSRDNMDFSHLTAHGVKLLPESGFSSLDDVRNYLLQYFTDEWVDTQMSSDFFIFREYDNMLFISPDGSAYGLSYISFRDATHTLAAYEQGRAVVRTTALHGPWHMLECCPWEEIEWLFEYADVYFHFIDGNIHRINTITWYSILFGTAP